MEIPEHLQPNKPVEDIQVDVVDERAPGEHLGVEVGTREEIAKVADELGLMVIGKDLLRSIEGVGARVEGIGVVKVANGLAYLTSAAAVQVAMKLAQDAITAATPSAREKAATCLAKLIGAIDKPTRTLKGGISAPVKPTKPGPMEHGSWAPHQHVHFHQHGVPDGNDVAKGSTPE